MPRSSKPRKKYNPQRVRPRSRITAAERSYVEGLLRQAQLTLLLKLPQGTATAGDLAILRDFLNWMQVSFSSPRRRFREKEIAPWRPWLSSTMYVVHDVMIAGDEEKGYSPGKDQLEKMLDGAEEAGKFAEECFDADPILFLAEWRAMGELSHNAPGSEWSVHKEVTREEVIKLVDKAYAGRI